MQVRSWGYEPIVASCESGLGMDEAVAALAGKTSVVAGPSGRGMKKRLLLILCLPKYLRIGFYRRVAQEDIMLICFLLDGCSCTEEQ